MMAMHASIWNQVPKGGPANVEQLEKLIKITQIIYKLNSFGKIINDKNITIKYEN